MRNQVPERLGTSMKEIWKEAARSLGASWRTWVGFQIVYGLAVTLAFSPLVHLVLRELVRATGNAAVTNFDLTSFFLSAKGISFLLVAGLGGLISWRIQQATLLLLTVAHGTAPFAALRRIMNSLRSLLALTFIQVGSLFVLLLPFGLVVLLVWRFLLGDQDINYYLHTKPPQWYGALLLTGMAGLATLASGIGLLTRWAYAMPLVLRLKGSAVDSLRRSVQLTRGQWVLPLVTVGGFWGVFWGVSNAFSAAILGIGRTILPTVQDHVGLSVLAVLVIFGALGITAVTTGTLGPIIHSILINRLFEKVSGMIPAPLPPSLPKDRRTLRRISLAIVGATLGGLTISLSSWLRRLDFTDPVRITAHRGSSADAPENTMSALRQALKDGADFAEIDVQTTQDGEVVLLHDRDLMRMGGDPRALASLTLKELRAIDVGIHFGEKFRGEQVPTLKEALEMVRGRMGLNIELKYNRPDPTLAPKVIAVLLETDMMDQCVITSLDLDALREAKALEPRLICGLIVTKALGDPTKLGVDFLSVNVKTVTRRLIRLAKKQGIDIHVWTVNDAATFEQMADRRVSVVISDHPAELAALRRSRAALSPTEQIALRLRRLLTR